MKTCPVCRAVAFDDAETCYGCLHRFGEGDSAEGGPDSGDVGGPASGTAFGPTPAPSADAAAYPVFTVRFMPDIDAAGALTWRCAVDAP